MKNAPILLVSAVIFWLVSVPLASWAGPMPYTFAEVWHVLLIRLGLLDVGSVDASALLIIGDIRLARVVLALLCGGALAISGVTLQGVLRNSLADPFTLGISAGAACGASLVLGMGSLWVEQYGLTVHGGLVAGAAFLGALIALACALLLGRAGGTFSRETVILAGIAVATFLGAVVALIKALNEESVTSIVFWIMGSFQGRGWDSLPWLAAPLLLGGLCVALHWRELDVLSLGDVQAAQLGMAVGHTRLVLLAGASCMTAACVAVSGVIGFVGLVAPHMLRQWLGAGHGRLLIGAWFAGGILLVWADVLARTVLGDGQELPVGVVTALLGGPFFALFVRQRAKPL